MIEFEGIVAYLGKPTKDGRMLTDLSIERDREIPIRIYPEPGESRVVGRIDSHRWEGDDLHVEGRIEADVIGDCCTGGIEIVGGEWSGDTSQEDVIKLAGAILRGFTVHDNPAWDSVTLWPKIRLGEAGQ